MREALRKPGNHICILLSQTPGYKEHRKKPTATAPDHKQFGPARRALDEVDEGSLDYSGCQAADKDLVSSSQK